MTVGAAGGPRIISSVLQIILNVIDFNMTVQEAVDAPRIHHQWLPDEIKYEKQAISIDVKTNLLLLNNTLVQVNNYLAEAHAIVVDDKGNIYLGAADPRRGEGRALGY